ncbi:MAG: FAD-binding protein [Erysipelotrichaceae bacterium]|nr:FAD-binding protein [Erysipelotrichaceae bacterium]
MLKIENLKVYEDLDKEAVIDKALRKARINPRDVIRCSITRKSIDARDKKDVHYSYSFDVEVNDERKYPKLKKAIYKPLPEIKKNRTSQYSPVIVGSGPAGLFCALTLAENGYKPIIIEQGDCVEQRQKYVQTYRETGRINSLCNVQFGEGGAGTFSDGKLTTGINSPYIKKVLDTFYRFGAPEDITYLSHPHIGTDNLVNILVNIRKYITERGGQYHFNTKMTDIESDNGIIRVICNDKCFTTDALVLAIGHSARSTFEMLYHKNVEMRRKNFSVGVRIEHLQEMINESQYGTETKLKLPAAEYKLVYHDDERTCYSFCMCPGGEVMASGSDEDGIVTNGMSYYKRDGRNANSGLLVNVNTDDLPGDNVLEGLYFQKELEHKAFVAGGSNHHAPVQRFEDFEKGCVSNHIGRVIPTYKPGYTFADLNEILPNFVSTTLKKGIRYFDTKIAGFADPDAILTGVETRTSSPVTILRNDDLVCSMDGVYPCGEGAGYAGGITSAAVDGIKVALKIMEKV